MCAIVAVEHRFQPHEVSILIFGGPGVGRFFGCCPRRKVSMMRIGPPQQGTDVRGFLVPRAWR
jgi:hypothetical protein